MTLCWLLIISVCLPRQKVVMLLRRSAEVSSPAKARQNCETQPAGAQKSVAGVKTWRRKDLLLPRSSPPVPNLLTCSVQGTSNWHRVLTHRSCVARAVAAADVPRKRALGVSLGGRTVDRRWTARWLLHLVQVPSQAFSMILGIVDFHESAHLHLT